MIRELPEKLKTLRVDQNLSQKEVARRLHVSPSIISAYETGERTPSVEALISLSYLYHCSADYLLGIDAERPPVALDTSKLNAEQVRALARLIRTMEKQ